MSSSPENAGGSWLENCRTKRAALERQILTVVGTAAGQQSLAARLAKPYFEDIARLHTVEIPAAQHLDAKLAPMTMQDYRKLAVADGVVEHDTAESNAGIHLVQLIALQLFMHPEKGSHALRGETRRLLARQ